jgi:uncharacterized protein YndB with AHSA1/START domain
MPAMHTTRPTRATRHTPSAWTGAFLALAVGLSSCGTPQPPGVPMTIDRTAPVISRDEILIDAPLERVWRIQTDISSWPQWRPTVPRARLAGELRVGSVFYWEEAGLQITSTVRELEPLRRIVWTGPAQGIDAIHVWNFEPTERGLLVQTEESWTGEPAVKMAATLQPILDGALRDWLSRLKERAEQGHRVR